MNDFRMSRRAMIREALMERRRISAEIKTLQARTDMLAQAKRDLRTKLIAERAQVTVHSVNKIASALCDLRPLRRK